MNFSKSETSFSFVHSDGAATILENTSASLLASTYQAGKFLTLRSVDKRVSTLFRSFDQAMGLAVDKRRIAVGTRSQLWFLHNAPDIASQLEPPGTHDACFLPRLCHVTGDIRVHEIAWGDKDLWLVNTRFSCLCTLHDDYSFVPRWRPPFVTALAAEDRCHLNGLAMADGRPKYVTALDETDSAEGWRANKATGGIVIDVPTGEVVARGFSMPHSPRIYNGQLWLLDSGTGRLVVVDTQSGRHQTVAQFPGYVRGLAFYDRYAFVGLSKARETTTFGDLPISARQNELKCGIWILDLTRGQIVGFFEFEKDVEEIFDVQILPGIRYPAVVGFQKDTIHGAFVIPPEGHGL